MKWNRQRCLEMLLLLGGILVVFVNAFVGQGCGTIVNQASGKRLVYGGVRADVQMMREGDGGSAMGVLDVPFSIAADTIMLPFDVFSPSADKTNAPAKK